MVQADPSHAIIRREVQSVQFGFYTDDDVRSRSVVEVTSPQAIDSMGVSLPNGLYDIRFGPTQASAPPCITCGCQYSDCGGHAGHLELSVPIYHPLLFGNLVKLLRTKCLACHKFRAEPRQLQIFQTKFSLIHQGRAKEALELDQALAVASRNATKNVLKSSSIPLAIEQALDQVLLEKQQALENAPPSVHELTSYERSLKQQLVKEFISSNLGCKKCNHCGAFSPKIRQDSSNKIFQAPLSESSKRMNQADNVVLKSALEKLNIVEEEGDGYNSDDTRPERNDDSDDDMEKEDDLQDSSDDETMQQQQQKQNEKSKKEEEKKTGADKYMHALEVEAQVKWTYLLYPQLAEYVFQKKELYFMRAIPVTPARFRPPMILGEMTVEHAQNSQLNKMLQQNAKLRALLSDKENAKAQAMAYSTWIDLQTTVNIYMDSSKDPSAAASMNPQNGIRQILEKKEGIFRKHMMGKRVDFACRSVISPDPYVGTNEIGIPLHFAKTLTYPTPVNGLNAVQMRELVIRGPHEYPGASWVQFPSGRRVNLGKMNRQRREGLAARLLTHMKKGGPPATVGRQLRNGDMMLVNRQPTLHKPGIMAHSVRVLHSPTQKTIRMHYANCNTYNADFDGDEMNCHFPQNDLASAESKYIAATDLQYIVPTDGSPLRGLIQDHVDSGVKMTSKDTFFEKWEYQQLIFAALASLPGLEVIRSDADIELLPPAIMKPKELWTGKQVISTLLHNLRRGNDRDDNGPRGKILPGISVERKAKTPEHGFGSEQEEHLVIIRDGELLRGVLDKAAYGSTEFSLVHAVYEAYGPDKAGLLLNSLGRLFTAHLQYYSGHSCRMEDLILTKEADAHRQTLVQRAYNVGSRAARAWADSEGGKVEIESVVDKPEAEEPLKPFEKAAASAKIASLLSGSEGKENFAALDGYMQSQLNPLASEIIKACLPNGLAVPFPTNTFGLMVSTGAKGSTVNQSQVSCALGQQALEGRRVPRMSSGRTLPSFAPYDPNPRADGFIMDRFLTGIRPQEYYFHCMAGREGLVDTAVKTSRSGYLQRCLVKHLEELKVCYDSTVRNGEGGVVQFLYGEDGLDPTKATYLDCSSSTFEYMARNHDALALRNRGLPDVTMDLAAKDAEMSAMLSNESVPLIEVGSFVKAKKLRVGSRWIRGAFCQGWFDAIVVKRHENGEFDLKYLKDGKIAENVPEEVDLGRCGGVTIPAASSLCTLIKLAVPDPILSGATRESGEHRLGSSGACVSEKVAGSVALALKTDKKLQEAMKSTGLSSRDFSNLVAAKYGSAVCDPGEAVGSIAAQSVGEPSTQMTLNTFHLAGSGANVTLGIPRLREIIMTASKELKTPTMSVPLDPSVSDKEAVRMTRDFTKLSLLELIASHKGIQVDTTLEQIGGGSYDRAYYITLKLHPAERIMDAFGLKLSDIASVVAERFFPKLGDIMKRELRKGTKKEESSKIDVSGAEKTEYIRTADDDNDSENNSADADSDGEEDSSGKADSSGNGRKKKPKLDNTGATILNEKVEDQRRKRFEKKAQEMNQDDLEEEEGDEDEVAGEEEGVKGSTLGRKDEMTSYGDKDDEDLEALMANAGRSEDDYESEDEGDGEKSDEEPDQESSQATTTPSSRGRSSFLGSYDDDGNTVKIDKENNSLILAPLTVDPAARELLMVGLVERAASATLVRSKKNIDQAFINEEDKGRGRCLQTAGVNFTEIWQLPSCKVKHDMLSSNDIWAIRCAYGVEAARLTIVEQIRSVFGAYGISVDPRHLSLIADYMTYDGGFKAMNRIGMADCDSPFLQMSFETTANFMLNAALGSQTEHLVSPSANIVLGRPIRHGTGAFDLLAK